MSLDGHTGNNTTTAYVPDGVTVQICVLTNVAQTQNAVFVDYHTRQLNT